jgi:hypothetical protein
MNHPAPEYLLPYILIGTAAVVAAVLFGLYGAAKFSPLPARDRRRAVWSGFALLLAWLFAALLLSWLGFYQGAASQIPTIQYGVLLPIVAGILLYWRWPALQSIIQAAPQSWIVGIQVFRTLGLIFLVLYAAGRLPGAFAEPAGVGDVLVGLLAPFIAIAYARRWRGSAALVQTWNLLGIADLVVALTTGFLTSPSRLQTLAFDRPNELISAFPLAMIPVFLVPLSLLLHFASLAKLRLVSGMLRAKKADASVFSSGVSPWLTD